MTGMGDRGSFGIKIPPFPLLFLGLTAMVIVTIIAVRPDTWNVSTSSVMASDERSLKQRMKYRRQEAEDVQTSPATAKKPQPVRANDNVVQVEEEGIQEDQEVESLQVFRIWDSNGGCEKFQEKIRDHGFRNSSAKSLQPEDLVKCEDLQKQHVSVVVKITTWIPNSLNGFHTCRCGLTCLWTKSEVVADDADVHLYEGYFPPFEVSTHPVTFLRLWWSPPNILKVKSLGSELSSPGYSWALLEFTFDNMLFLTNGDTHCDPVLFYISFNR